jgi:hypothetical protein
MYFAPDFHAFVGTIAFKFAQVGSYTRDLDVASWRQDHRIFRPLHDLQIDRDILGQTRDPVRRTGRMEHREH